MRLLSSALWAALIVAICSAAVSAQFITGITRPTFGGNMNPVDVFLVDVNSGQSSFLYDPLALPNSSPGFTGLAANEADAILYATVRNGAQDDLYRIDYASFTPSLIGTITIDGTGRSFDGLAYDTLRGVLYGTRTLGGTTGVEGLFSIDLNTAAATLAFEYETTATSNYNIGGIDYDALTDRIYLADDDDTGGRNIYAIDPASIGSGLALVASYPTEITDVDGIGAGEGKLYLLSDGNDDQNRANFEGNGGEHYVYDIAMDAFSVLGPSPYPAYANSALGPLNPSGAGAYAPSLIPEPSPALPLMFGLILLVPLMRQRR